MSLCLIYIGAVPIIQAIAKPGIDSSHQDLHLTELKL